MAVESVNYQCPACGGPLHFSESKGPWSATTVKVL